MKLLVYVTNWVQGLHFHTDLIFLLNSAGNEIRSFLFEHDGSDQTICNLVLT